MAKKKSTSISSNEITNPAILQSIENYETGKVKPKPLVKPEGA